MRCLQFVSVVLFCCTSCAPVAYKKLQQTEGNAHCIQQFKPDIQRALFQTSVDVVGNHLSGILVIKQMPDSSTRIVFTNEAGFTFFDFEFAKDGAFTVHSLISKMDKEAVKKTLRKDFELVLMNRLHLSTARIYKKGNERYYAFEDDSDVFYYITDPGCTQLLRMERGDSKRKVLEATRGAMKNGVPETLRIHHNNFNFTIDLKWIYDNAEG